MATTSEVKAGLDDISKSIRDARQSYIRSKSTITTMYNQLQSIPTTFEDVLAEINAYTGADEFEALCQAELARLTTEFIALSNLMNALISTPEFSAEQ